MTIKIVKEKIKKNELLEIVEEIFGIAAKAAVDIEKEILAIGGEFHIEAQDLLVKQEDSDAQDVWGINFYPFNLAENRIEYTALINIKAGLGHRNMRIEKKEIRDKIKIIINKLLLGDNETLAPQN